MLKFDFMYISSFNYSVPIPPPTSPRINQLRQLYADANDQQRAEWRRLIEQEITLIWDAIDDFFKVENEENFTHWQYNLSNRITSFPFRLNEISDENKKILELALSL